MWVSGYYGAWEPWIMTPDKIDFSIITHVLHFVLVPSSTGTFIPNSDFSIANSKAVVDAAHNKNRKALLSIGGWDSDVGFYASTKSATTRNKFISTIVSFIKTRNYDGVDIDWEPVPEAHATAFKAFLVALKAALVKAGKPIMTVATVSGWHYRSLLSLRNSIDQINLMTYDLGGLWIGKSWYNSPLYNGNNKDAHGDLLPSVDDMVKVFTAAKFPASKLGIGLPFYGKVITGVNNILAPTATATVEDIVYRDIQAQHGTTIPTYDTVCKTPFYSLPNIFITFDNEQSIKDKIDYAKAKGLGGIILFELGQGWIPEATVPDPLVQAVKADIALA